MPDKLSDEPGETGHTLEAELIRLSDPVHEQLGYYVYRLVDPFSGETFYVGKGKGGRLLQHVADARASSVETRKLDRIRAIEADGRRVSFLVHRHGLTEKEAYEVEAALIDAYAHEFNVADGHHNEERGCMPLSELAAKYDPPKRQVTVPAVLINIGTMPWTSPSQSLSRGTSCELSTPQLSLALSVRFLTTCSTCA